MTWPSSNLPSGNLPLRNLPSGNLPSGTLLALSVCLIGSLACSGSSPPGGTGQAGTGSPEGAAGTSGAAGTGGGQAGDGGPGAAGTTGGVAGTGGGAGTSGVAGGGGAGTSGAAGGGAGMGAAGTTGAAGTGGKAGTGAAGTTGVAGSNGAAGTTGAAGAGADPCGTPPWRALNVTAQPGLHAHGGNAALDTRAKPIGKLSVNLGVSGAGFSSWLVKRGYHGLGASFPACAAPNLGGSRDTVGNCRINTEWGAIKTSVVTTVQNLAKSNPEEDWGYFLTKDGTDVRWGDVAFTGVSHGATTAAIIGRIGVCAWRLVSCAGPRDNTCGKGPFTLPYNPASPPFDPNCATSEIASWLDQPSKTPMDRFYVIDGVTDGEYGDIMFNVERTKYPGQPVQFDVANPVLTGTNRFVSMGGGHLDFLNAADTVKPTNTNLVLDIAFAIPPENQNPNF
jgi:hypothetical protein